jgi:hypothetical protein
MHTYLLTYGSIPTNAPVLVDYLGSTPPAFSVSSTAGPRVVETYVDNSSLREFPFNIQSMESTADDLDRIATSGFFEALADWFDTNSQTIGGVLPVLDVGKSANKIEALGWAFLQIQGQSETGVYAIQCKITYDQVAP